MKKHILVISQYFYPENFRINDICQEWVKRGFKVTVVTGIPNYPEGTFYKGFGIFKRRKEIWNGVEIIRLPIIPRKKGSIMLMLNYLSFVVSGFFWKLFTKIRADYTFTFEVSPMTQALIGVWYSKKYKIPNYLYVQDLWPDNVEVVTGIHTKMILNPIKKMVDYIYANCDEIFATSPSFVKEICKYGIEAKKVHYWPQYAEEFYKPVEIEATENKDDENIFSIIFTGNVGYAQGLQILPGVAKLLKNSERKVLFKIVGDGRYKEELIKDIHDKNIQDMFCLVNRQPAEKIPKLLCECDVAFLSFMDNKLFENTIPAKLQSYMACGMPIIAAAGGETKRIIEEAKCGICCKIGDEKGLADIVEKMIRMSKFEMRQLRENSLKYAVDKFNKDNLIKEIMEYFK